MKKEGSQDLQDKRKLGLRISAVIFLIISLLHFIRLLTRAGAVVLGWQVPLWFSLLALIAFGSLSVWLYSLAGRE